MISKHKRLGLKHYDDANTLLKNSNNMQNDYTLKCFLNLEIKWIVNAMKLLKNFESLIRRTHNLNKISLNRDRSYTVSSKWLRNKKLTLNPKNNANKFFQYTLTVTLSHEQI